MLEQSQCVLKQRKKIDGREYSLLTIG
jgi:hypothetical protein